MEPAGGRQLHPLRAGDRRSRQRRRRGARLVSADDAAGRLDDVPRKRRRPRARAQHDRGDHELGARDRRERRGRLRQRRPLVGRRRHDGLDLRLAAAGARGLHALDPRDRHDGQRDGRRHDVVHRRGAADGRDHVPVTRRTARAVGLHDPRERELRRLLRRPRRSRVPGGRPLVRGRRNMRLVLRVVPSRAPAPTRSTRARPTPSGNVAVGDPVAFRVAAPPTVVVTAPADASTFSWGPYSIAGTASSADSSVAAGRGRVRPRGPLARGDRFHRLELRLDAGVRDPLHDLGARDRRRRQRHRELLGAPSPSRRRRPKRSPSTGRVRRGVRQGQGDARLPRREGGRRHLLHLLVRPRRDPLDVRGDERPGVSRARADVGRDDDVEGDDHRRQGEDGTGTAPGARPRSRPCRSPSNSTTFRARPSSHASPGSSRAPPALRAAYGSRGLAVYNFVRDNILNKWLFDRGSIAWYHNVTADTTRC